MLAVTVATRALGRTSPGRLAGWLVLVAATASVFLYTTAFHEFWRDEVQTVLIARAVPFERLVSALRTEGVPPLVFVVLKVLDVLPTPYPLSALAAIGYATLLFGTYRLLLSITQSPARSMVATVAFAFTDTYFYELGVVVRQYGLGLGLALACAASLAQAIRSEQPRHARWGALFGALAASTTAHSACLAGAALLSFSIVRFAQKPALRSVAAPLCALPAFLFTFFVIAPYPDRAAENLAVAQPTVERAITEARALLIDSVLCPGWWHPETFDSLIRGIIELVKLAFAGALALGWRGLWRRPCLVAFYAAVVLLNGVTLLYIFIYRYSGAYRHHLFMFIPVMIIGVALSLAPSDSRGPGRLLQLVPLALLLPWFLYQFYVCGSDLVRDHEGAFSQTRAASSVFPADARVVIAGPDTLAAGLLFWRPDLSMRSLTSAGRSFRYMIADRRWHESAALDPILADECRRAPEVFVVGPGGQHPGVTGCATDVASQSPSLLSESFEVFKLSCACQLKGR